MNEVHILHLKVCSHWRKERAMKNQNQPTIAAIVSFTVIIFIARISFSDVDVNFSMKGGDSGLKDVEGSKTSKEADGVTYILATGEAVTSGTLRSGKAVIASAAIVKEVTDRSLTLKFKDQSIRTWAINDKTPICDESGKAISLASIANDKVVCVRWEIRDKESLKLEKSGEALSIRNGHIRYKLIEADGSILERPVLADCACASNQQLAEKSANVVPPTRLKDISEKTRTIESKETAVGEVAAMLVDRGVTYAETKQTGKAIADFSRAIEIKEASPLVIAKALFNRGVAYGQIDEAKKAIEDYTRVIEMMNAPSEQVASALLNRGITYGELKQINKELADYTRLIHLKDAPTNDVARALVARSEAYRQMEEFEKALADYAHLLEIKNLPVELVARPLRNRGVMYAQRAEYDKAIVDFTTVIELKGAPIEQVAGALYNRGAAYHRLKETQKALADFRRVRDMKSAPPNLIAAADRAIRQLSSDR
jgi:tetratricopeptide (TPR) repeat protein